MLCILYDSITKLHLFAEKQKNINKFLHLFDTNTTIHPILRRNDTESGLRTLLQLRDYLGRIHSFTITSNVLKISLMSYQKLAFFTYSR